MKFSALWAAFSTSAATTLFHLFGNKRIKSRPVESLLYQASGTIPTLETSKHIVPEMFGHNNLCSVNIIDLRPAI
ncbi:hypothetical protein DPMN_170838 [Dreissena polymorpha]|uniref:Uncharacterized protein n=1 Tax=Dreissena polymorpha TaxID=45954 RepID=A0A9D4ID77_DREPO|nr:hypothetical protein DPMN_170838 [Dreissena polymorpha]